MSIPASDDFNRADGGLGANWTASPGALAIANHFAVAPGTGYNLSFWNADTFSANQWSECAVFFSGSTYNGPVVRAASGGNGYLAVGSSSGLGQFIELHKYFNTVDTVLMTFTGLTLSDGDVIRLSVSSTTLTVSLNGSVLGTFTDSTFSTGQPGIFVFQSAGGGVDNWNADNFSASVISASPSETLKISDIVRLNTLVASVQETLKLRDIFTPKTLTVSVTEALHLLDSVGSGLDEQSIHIANALQYISDAQVLLAQAIVKLDGGFIVDARTLITQAQAKLTSATIELQFRLGSAPSNEGLRIRDTAIAQLSTTSASVLVPADFTYLGSAPLPLNIDGQTRFGYSTGALSGRVVSGQIHLFVTGAQADTGWMDPVYEVLWNGVGNRCTMVQNWGDVTLGLRVSASGNPKPIHGLLWDPISNQLLSMYTDQYNVGGYHDPCLFATTLSLPNVTVAGPWRLADHSMRVGGYMVTHPTSGRFAAGAPLGSGNATSPWGAFLSEFALPAPGTPADVTDTTNSPHITIPTTHLIYSDFFNKQPRTNDVDDCGWTHYGESDNQGAQPQFNPTQNGSGCTVNGQLCGVSFGPISVWTLVDTITAAAWINGSNKQGLVMLGQIAKTMSAYSSEYGALGRCHTWYGPAQEFGVHKLCAHGQNDTRYGYSATGPGVTTQQSSIWIYSQADLALAAVGSLSPILLPPTTDAADMSTIPHSGAAYPQLAGTYQANGGAWFEPVSKTLFITEVHAEFQGEWRPIVHAFSVNC